MEKFKAYCHTSFFQNTGEKMLSYDENIELKLSKKIDRYNEINLLWDKKKKTYMIDSSNISFNFREN